HQRLFTRQARQRHRQEAVPRRHRSRQAGRTGRSRRPDRRGRRHRVHQRPRRRAGDFERWQTPRPHLGWQTDRQLQVRRRRQDPVPDVEQLRRAHPPEHQGRGFLMEIWYVFGSIVLLVLLISWGKIQPFLAFLVASSVAAILLKLPMEKVPDVLEQGIGKILGGLIGIVCLGAMYGKLIANSGAAQKIAMVLMRLFGEKYLTWALMFTGFIVGIPLFYNVGFVLLVPLVFSVVQQTKVPPIYLGIPLFASLSVTHGYLPPHPAPTAMLPIFGADISKTLLYGIVVALPAMICAGPLYARLFRNVKSNPITLFVAPLRPEAELPGAFNCFASALLPVVIIALSMAVPLAPEN